MTDLLPCPFCECEMDIAVRNYECIKTQRYSIVHPDNGCILEGYESREFSARGELVDKWNKRYLNGMVISLHNVYPRAKE